MQAATASVFDPVIRTLPSGHSGLARDLVDTSQRQRLLHGVVATVADKGYGPTTVADIAARAGVSKKTLYAHFPDKQSCFLAAYELGRQAMVGAVRQAALATVDAGASPVAQLRASTAAYLDFVVAEEFYARVFFLETLAAGPEAVAAQRASRADFTEGLRSWHRHARASHSAWPEASDLAYEAASAAIHEITVGRIATGRAAELPGLLDELVEIQLAILHIPQTPETDR